MLNSPALIITERERQTDRDTERERVCVYVGKGGTACKHKPINKRMDKILVIFLKPRRSISKMHRRLSFLSSVSHWLLYRPSMKNMFVLFVWYCFDVCYAYVCIFWRIKVLSQTLAAAYIWMAEAICTSTRNNRMFVFRYCYNYMYKNIYVIYKLLFNTSFFQIKYWLVG